MVSFSVRRYELYSALQKMEKVADHKSSMEALHMVLLNPTTNELQITATNLNTTLTTTIRLDGQGEPVAVNCRALTKILKCKKKEESTILFRQDKNTLTLALTQKGIPSTIELPTYPLELYPEIVPHVSTDWSYAGDIRGEDFMQKLEYVWPSISDDECRPHISTLAIKDGNFVTTDGHRLHLIKGLDRIDTNILIPFVAVNLLRKFAKGTEFITFAEHKEKGLAKFTLEYKNSIYTFMVKTSNADFPPYNQVIPSSTDFVVSVDIDQLKSALTQINTLSDGDTRAVKAIINGALTLQFESPQTGKAKFYLDLLKSTKEQSDDFEIGVNPIYLLDALQKEEGYVDIGLNGTQDPIRVDHGQDNGLAIVMPMRV
jgi:DNA polymerase-3 subunit beta